MLAYKYLSPDRIGFLKDGLIRFTPPGALNDPYECLPALSESIVQAAVSQIRHGIAESYNFGSVAHPSMKHHAQAQCEHMIKEFVEKLEIEPDLFRTEFFRITSEKINKGLGVLSLSSRWDSALMWSHYTVSYEGFCVGFNKDHDFFKGFSGKAGGRHPLSPVEYTEERVVMKGSRLSAGDPERLFFVKSKDWEYEREERMLAFLEFADKTIPSSPFPISLFKIPKDAIAEIIVGSRASDQLRALIFEAADSCSVPVYETKVSNMSFDVERSLVRR